MEALADKLSSERNAHIIHINFTLTAFENLLEYHALEAYVEAHWQYGRENYLLIDEVQMCPSFEKAINSLHAKEKYSIFVTGSNAFLQSSDLATLFVGRTYEIHVFPFSFNEYLTYFPSENPYGSLSKYMAEGGLAAFDHAVNMAMMLYASRVNQAQWTFLSSHDTPRFLHRAGEDPGRLRQAAFFQLTAPGVPIVYYGDELGMTGAGDPDCRRPMRWDLVKDNSLLAYYRRLIHLRSSLPALALGDFRTVRAADDGLYAYLRTGETPVLCALCTSEADFVTPLRLPEELSHAMALHDHLSGEKLTVHNGEVRLACAPGKGFILSAEQAG